MVVNLSKSRYRNCPDDALLRFPGDSREFRANGKRPPFGSHVITLVSRVGISFLRLSHEVKRTSLTNTSARPQEAVKTFGNLPPVGWENGPASQRWRGFCFPPHPHSTKTTREGTPIWKGKCIN